MGRKKSVSKKKREHGNTSTHHIVALKLPIGVYRKLLLLAEQGGVAVASYVKMIIGKELYFHRGDHISKEERKDR